MALTTGKILSAFGKIGILAVIAVAFGIGLIGTIYLSLRSPEIQVPDVVNRTYLDGESTLVKAGLDIRERAKRFKQDVKPGIILDQSPRPGEVVKAGQTVAVVVSREPKEGEKTEVVEEKKPGPTNEQKPAEGAGNSNVSNGNAAAANENRSREQRNRNTNRNGNSNNRNANGNRNANNQNSNNRNANTRNANSNVNRNAGANVNANRNGNTNTRNADAGRNANRPGAANVNRRPNP